MPKELISFNKQEADNEPTFSTLGAQTRFLEIEACKPYKMLNFHFKKPIQS